MTALQQDFDNSCGNPTLNSNAGVGNLSWSNSGIYYTSQTFDQNVVYTLEADVIDATGTWPGLYWIKETSNKSYAMLINNTQARISLSGSGPGVCSGHNWASSLENYTSTTGIWSLTWRATGDILSEFPTVGTISSANSLYMKDEDLRIGIGGISSGSGTLDMNWIRARQLVDIVPSFSIGSLVMNNIVAVPQLDLGTDQLVCINTNTQLQVSSAFTSVLWSTGSNDTAIAVSTPGLYYVDVVDANGCSTSDSVVVSNHAATPLALANSQLICVESNAILTADTGFVSYDWSTGSMNNSTSVSQAGTYYLSATDANGCTTSDSIEVSYFFPAADLGIDLTVCVDDTATFTADIAYTSFLWSNGDTTSFINTNVAGTYTVTTTDTAGCVTSDSVVLSNHPVNQVVLGNDTLVCDFGGSMLLDAGSAGVTYLWNDGSNGSTLSAQANGLYSVICTDANGCSTSDSIAVTFAALPIVNAGLDQTVCPEDTAAFTADTVYNSYLWNTGDTTASITASLAGVYVLTATDSMGCVSTDSVLLVNHTLNPVNLGSDTFFCAGESFILDAGNGGVSYFWQDGSAGQTHVANITATYWVVCTDSNGCSTSDTTIIFESAAITSDFTSTTDQFDATFSDASTGNATTYSWDFGDGASSTDANPTHTYATEGNFTVCLTVTNVDGCSDVVCDTVTIIASVIAENSFGSNLNVFPNPTANQVTVAMDQLTAGNVALELRDMRGRVILQETIASAGSINHVLQLENVEDGLYVIALTKDGQSIQKRLVVAH